MLYLRTGQSATSTVIISRGGGTDGNHPFVTCYLPSVPISYYSRTGCFYINCHLWHLCISRPVRSACVNEIRLPAPSAAVYIYEAQQCVIFTHRLQLYWKKLPLLFVTHSMSPVNANILSVNASASLVNYIWPPTWNSTLDDPLLSTA